MINDFDVQKASCRFIEARTKAKKTQEQLAAELDINPQTIKNYEKAGSTNAQNSCNSRTNAIAGMKIETLYKVAKLLNVSADYLLGLSDVKSSNPDIQTAVEITGLSECSISNIQVMKNSFSLWDERIALINYFFSNITATLNLTSPIIDYGEKLISYQKEAKQYYQEYNKALFQSFHNFFQCADESELNIPRNNIGKIKAPRGSDPDGRSVQQMSDSCDAAMFKAQIAFNKMLDMMSKDICSQCEKAENSDGQD